MEKKVLYISLAYINNSPVGIRYFNFKNYLEANTNLTVLNLTHRSILYSQKNRIYWLLNRIIRRLPLLPDSDIFILGKYKKALKKLINYNEYDSVIIGILPFSFLYLTKFIKSINNKINVIVDMSDPISANMSFNSMSKIKRKFLISLEKNYLPYIDILIVLNEEIKEYYENKYDLKKIMVLEQGTAESGNLYELNHEELNLNDIVLIYAGNLYKKRREPFELYRAIENFNYNITLKVYGNFKQCFIPPNSKKFYYSRKISQEELNKIYLESHIIVFIDNKNTIQVPGKTLEILALNKPVLFIYYNSSSPTFKYMSEFEGMFYTKNKAKDIESAIRSIIDNKVFHYERDLSKYYWKNLLTKINDIL